MPQNSKKHIKEHIENFLEFYKKNKTRREVQVAKMKVYIARKSRKNERNPKPTVMEPRPAPLVDPDQSWRLKGVGLIRMPQN